MAQPWPASVGSDCCTSTVPRQDGFEGSDLGEPFRVAGMRRLGERHLHRGPSWGNSGGTATFPRSYGAGRCQRSVPARRRWGAVNYPMSCIWIPGQRRGGLGRRVCMNSNSGLDRQRGRPSCFPYSRQWVSRGWPLRHPRRSKNSLCSRCRGHPKVAGVCYPVTYRWLLSSEIWRLVSPS